jgi:hypothetical protein
MPVMPWSGVFGISGQFLIFQWVGATSRPKGAGESDDDRVSGRE